MYPSIYALARNTMNNGKLIEPFADFARSKNIDRPTMIRILEDVFRAMIRGKFGRDDNFDIIINLDKGDLQLWRFRKVIADHDEEIKDYDKIGLLEARKIEDDFEVGEEVAEEIPLNEFGRRAIIHAKQTLVQKVKDLAKEIMYTKYAQRVGELINVEVSQILTREVIAIDHEGNELFLPKIEQIPKDRFRKGESFRAIIHKVELQRSIPRVILSRTSPLFLERLFEQEIPEIIDGIITIKKVVREPGERAKVAVVSYDDRVDPVGACVGIKGARIHGIVRELQHENIDIINYTDNIDLYIARSLSPAKLSSIEHKDGRVAVYLKPDQVSLAIGKGGQNIKLASKLLGKEVDVYRELIAQEEDIRLEEFGDVIEKEVIEALKTVGLDTARSVLALSKDMLEKRTQLDKEKIDELYTILQQEFED